MKICPKAGSPLASETLKLLFKCQNRQAYLDSLVALVKKWTKASCVGIRILDEQGNIPYESFIGYSKDFFKKECMLSLSKDSCVCTRIIKGAPASEEKKSISKYGSFFHCNISEFVKFFSEKQLKKYRGECLNVGFSTLALIPIKHSNKIIAAIHIADRKANKFSDDKVADIEQVASLIGETINKFNLEEKNQHNYDIQRTINSLLKISNRDSSLENILRKSLDLLLSIPWLSFESTGSIFIKDENSEYFEMKAVKGIPRVLQKKCNKIVKGQCLCGLAAKSKKVVFTNKIDMNHTITHQGMKPHGHYCIPIKLNGQVLGILNIYVKHEYFRKEYEETFLLIFAETLAGIIQRKRSEQALSLSDRARIVLSQSNHALIHAQHENQLLAKICRIIVNSGKYRLAWVGKPNDDENKSVTVLARAGVHKKYLENIELSWAANKPSGNGPVGKSIRTKKIEIIRNTLTDPAFALWKYKAMKKKFGSVASLPLISNNNYFGFLAIYAKEINSFNNEEVSLLMELASDLAFGIYTLRLKKEKEQTDLMLKSSNRLLESAFSNTHFQMAYLDKNFNYKKVNTAYAQVNDLPENYFIGKNLFDLFPNDEMKNIFNHVLHTGKRHIAYEKPFFNKKKETAFWDWTIEPIKKSGGEITGLLFTIIDVTDRIKSEKKLMESYKHMGSINRRIAILLEMGEILETQSETILLSRIVNSAQNLSGATFVGIYKYHKKHKVFSCIYSNSKKNNICNLEINKNPINTYDLVHNKSRTQGTLSNNQKKVLGFDITQYVLKPIMTGGKLWGALFFGYDAEKSMITTQELEFYNVFVVQAGNALEKIKCVGDICYLPNRKNRNTISKIS